MTSEYDGEPIPGLPAKLPEGETLLWQGQPAAGSVFRHIMLGWPVAAYFMVLLAWRVLVGIQDGATASEIALNAVPLLTIAAVALSILGLIAVLTARTTIYSITTDRVLLRYGIAMPMTVDVPFTTILTAGLKVHPEGTGDIALDVKGPRRLGYLTLWPHVRPWHMRRTEPSLRCLPEPGKVADVLGTALEKALGGVASPALAAQSGDRAAIAIRPIAATPSAA